MTISPDITGLTLQGAGMHATVIDGGLGQGGRVFTIQAGTTAALFDMTITSGQAPDGGGGNNAGDLTMQRDDVRFNSAVATSPGVDGRGGGIYSTGTLSITDSMIFSNQAATIGGGVYTSGSTLARDLIDANIVRSGTAHDRRCRGRISGDLGSICARSSHREGDDAPCAGVSDHQVTGRVEI